MRVPSFRRQTDCDLDRSMTPMVDVVFQLLVFFVIAAAGRHVEQSLSTPLSAGAVSSADLRPPDAWVAELWVHLRRDARSKGTAIELNQRGCASVAELQSALAELGQVAPESPVILDVAGDVPIGDVLAVYDACRAARFRSINFAAGRDEIDAPLEAAR
jgi:biopolymer transport protein ExbD